MNQGGDGDEVRIPLTIDPDSSGLASAQQAAQRFEGTVDQLQARLRELEAQAVRTFNALFPGQQAAGSYREVLDVARRSGAQNFAASMPAPAAAVRQAEALREQLPEARARDRDEARRAREQDRARAREDRARPAPFSERLTENVLRARPLATMGAFASGDFRTGGMTLARAFIETLASSPSRRAVGTLAGAVATGGLGVAEGAAGEAAAGAAEGGGAAGLVGLLTGPIGLIGAAIAGMGAVALGLNEVRSQVRGQEYILRANLGGTAGADMSNVERGVLGQGQRFLVTPQAALALANQLGTAGVGAGQVPGAEATTLAMSRITGMDPTQIGQITAALMVQGHATVDQVGAVFQTLREGADRSGQSLTLLVRSLQDFQRTTGGTALGVQGAAGLAAVQGMVGPQVSAGGLFGPAMGLLGNQATAAAGVLGISPDQLERVQAGGDVAQLQDLMAAAAKRISGGRRGQVAINAVEQVFQQTGLLNMAGISPQNANRIIGGMLTQAPRAAEDRRDAALRAATFQREQQAELAILRAGEDIAGAETSVAAGVKLQGQYLIENIGLLGNNIATRQFPGGRAPGTVGVTPPGAYAPTPYTQAIARAFPHGMTVPNIGGSPNHITEGQLVQFARASGGDPQLLAMMLAQASQESGFNPTARNPSGAAGIGQFIPSTVRFIQNAAGSPFAKGGQYAGQTFDPYNSAQATAAMAWYDRFLLKQYGSEAAALAHYGPGSSYAAGISGRAAQVLAQLPAGGSTTQTQSHHTVNMQINVNDQSGNHVGTVHIQHTAARQPVGARTHGPAPKPVPSAVPTFGPHSGGGGLSKTRPVMS